MHIHHMLYIIHICVCVYIYIYIYIYIYTHTHTHTHTFIIQNQSLSLLTSVGRLYLSAPLMLSLAMWIILDPHDGFSIILHPFTLGLTTLSCFGQRDVSRVGSICERDLIWKQCLFRYNQVKISLYGITVNSNDWYPYKERFGDTQTHTGKKAISRQR